MKHILFSALFLTIIQYSFGQMDTLVNKVDTLATMIDTLATKIDYLSSEVECLNKKPEPKNREFLMSIGARFSFFAVENPTDLYYDITGFVPSIRYTRFGFYTMLNQTRFETGLVSTNELITNESTLIGVASTDTAIVANNSYYRTTVPLHNEHISLSFLPTYRLGRFSKCFFLFMHLEAIYGSYKRSISDELIGTDTLKMHMDDFNEIPENKNYPYNKTQEINENSFSSFLGAGILFRYDTKNISFQLFPSIGINFRQNYRTTFYGEHRGDIIRDLYYYLRFILIEKNTGIKLGGELRQIDIFQDNPAPSSYSITLSKQFSIEDIANFFKVE